MKGGDIKMETIEPLWLNTLLGVILPFVIQWLKNNEWNRKLKFLFALFISVIVGFLSAYFTNNLIFDIEKILTTIGYIFAISQTVYNLFKEELEKIL